jgi:phosphopantothenoylcysteine decarboxylase
MANVLLGVTGSVAAAKTPELFGLLTRKVTRSGRGDAAGAYFFDPAALRPHLVLDEDRMAGPRGWPAAAARRAGAAHRAARWAELLVVAPLDANTLAKLANGLADNCLTCVWRAWEPARPVVLAPGDEHAHVAARGDGAAPAARGRRWPPPGG